MKVAEIQFAPWDKKYFFSCDSVKLKLKDSVIVKTEIGTEVGKVVNF